VIKGNVFRFVVGMAKKGGREDPGERRREPRSTETPRLAPSGCVLIRKGIQLYMIRKRGSRKARAKKRKKEG